MRPANGRYRLTFQTPGGAPSTVTYEVTDAGIRTSFGLLPWDAAGDCFRAGAIALQCLGNGTFVGVNNSVVPPGGTEGTCVLLPA